MALLLEPLLQKYHDEHCCHHEIQTLRVEGDEIPEQTSQCGSADPVELVEQRYEEVEPAAVAVLGDLSGAVYAERFVAHAVDEVEFLPAHVLELVQHGNSVEQVPRLYHQRHHQHLERRERRKQHLHREELQTAAENHRRHYHRVNKAEPGNVHVDTVSHSQKQEPRKYRYSAGKRRPERPRYNALVIFHVV